MRRRDVQDVFLGTGLGPRAYAIIGQGTISRIIESKPEELRLFLEEAAGVSKYKERRRETENRLDDTRENLTRVEDILRELNANLEKLEKQAEVAARYNQLQADATRKQHQLWFLKRSRERGRPGQGQGRCRQGRSTTSKSRTADLRHVEAELETVRQAHYAAGDQVNQAQGKLYEASAEVGRLEGEIRFVVEGRQRVEQRLVQLREQIAQWGTRQRRGRGRDRDPGRRRASTPRSRPRCWPRSSKSTTRALPELEEAQQRSAGRGQRAARAAWRRCSSRSRCWPPTSATSRSRSRQLNQRARAPGAPTSNALAAPDEARLRRPAGAARSRAGSRRDEADARLHELQDRCRSSTTTAARGSRPSTPKARARPICRRAWKRSRRCRKRSRPTASSQPWLAKHGLDGLQGLWSRIHIEQGWENALEAALRERLGALEVSRLDMVRAFGGDAPPAKLAFYSPPAAARARSAARALPRLADLLRLNDAGQQALLADWLHGCYTAATLEEALAAARQAAARRGDLRARAAMRSRAHSVSFYAQDSEQAGLLARQQEIENLERQLRAQALIATRRAPRWCAPRPPTPMPRSAWSRRAAKPPRRSRARTSCRSRRCA